ncbi:hypothetical protein N2152v2_010311 [Parachlorella kessleri]
MGNAAPKPLQTLAQHELPPEGAADAALTLSRTRLFDLAPNTTSASQLPSLCASLVHVVEACRVAQLLLRTTAVAIEQGCELEPSVVFRLASCVGVAHGPAAEAAQLVFARAAGLSEHQKAITARLLAYAYQHILSTAASAVSLVQKLEGREPAAALRAKLCRPEKASPLCHQCADALEWCAQQQVPILAAMKRLAELVQMHVLVDNAYRVVGDGKSGPALASLAISHYANFCKQLQRKLHLHHAATAAASAAGPQAGSASRDAVAARLMQWLPLLIEEFTHAFRLVLSTVRWFNPASAAAALGPATMAVANLLHLARGVAIEATHPAQAVIAVALLLISSLPGPTNDQRHPEHGQTRQRLHQQQTQLPTICLEAFTLCCSSVAAELEIHLLSGTLKQSHPVGSPSLYSVRSLTACLQFVSNMLEVLPGSLRKAGLAKGQLETALAAAEAALRLVGCLATEWGDLRLMPGAQQAGLLPSVAPAIKRLLDFVGQLANAAIVRCFVATQHGSTAGCSGGSIGARSGGSNSNCDNHTDTSSADSLSFAERKLLAPHLAHLAATAAKVAQLLSQPVLAAPLLPRDDAWLINTIGATCHLLKGNDDLVQSQLEGLMLPLLYGLHSLSTAMPGTLKQQATSQPGAAPASASRITALVGLLSCVVGLPHLAGLGLQERVMTVLCGAWQAVVAGAAVQNSTQAYLDAQAHSALVCIATTAVGWTRAAAAAAVQTGLLDAVACWAQSAARSGNASSPHVAWRVVEVVTGKLRPQGSDGAGTAAAATVAQAVVTSRQRLRALTQRKQLGCPSFWQVKVRQQLLPALGTLASAALAAEAPAPGENQLRGARALATRVCANPGCLNLRGCSEARLRSQRCSGCGVARYCCRQCQVDDYAVHGRVCRQLGAEAPAAL